MHAKFWKAIAGAGSVLSLVISLGALSPALAYNFPLAGVSQSWLDKFWQDVGSQLDYNDAEIFATICTEKTSLSECGNRWKAITEISSGPNQRRMTDLELHNAQKIMIQLFQKDREKFSKMKFVQERIALADQHVEKYGVDLRQIILNPEEVQHILDYVPSTPADTKGRAIASAYMIRIATQADEAERLVQKLSAYKKANLPGGLCSEEDFRPSRIEALFRGIARRKNDCSTQAGISAQDYRFDLNMLYESCDYLVDLEAKKDQLLAQVQVPGECGGARAAYLKGYGERRNASAYFLIPQMIVDAWDRNKVSHTSACAAETEAAQSAASGDLFQSQKNLYCCLKGGESGAQALIQDKDLPPLIREEYHHYKLLAEKSCGSDCGGTHGCTEVGCRRSDGSIITNRQIDEDGQTALVCAEEVCETIVLNQENDSQYYLGNNAQHLRVYYDQKEWPFFPGAASLGWEAGRASCPNDPQTLAAESSPLSNRARKPIRLGRSADTQDKPPAGGAASQAH